MTPTPKQFDKKIMVKFFYLLFLIWNNRLTGSTILLPTLASIGVPVPRLPLV